MYRVTGLVLVGVVAAQAAGTDTQTQICGTVSEGPGGCMGIEASLTGEFFAVENLGEFAAGEQALVAGTLQLSSSFCEPAYSGPGFVDNTIQESCLTIVPLGSFEGCGEWELLTDGLFVCGIHFFADDGSIFRLIDVPEGFDVSVGDRFHVEGVIDIFNCPFIADCSPQLCLDVTSFGSCPMIESCGTILEGPEGCVMFLPDGETRQYFIENDGGLQAGDRALVSGELSEEFALCPPLPAFPSIIKNSAEAVSAADLDCDGTVGAADLATLLGHWGRCPGKPCPSDLDGDGSVGPSDLAQLLGAWS